MFCELYIDVFFLVNFMMDYLVLLTVKQMTKCHTTQLRIFTSSVLSALLTCSIYLLPINNNLVKFILFHIVMNTIIIRVGFKFISIRIFAQCMISLYVASFLLGGVFYYFQQYLKIGSLYFFIAIASYRVVRGIWWFIEGLKKQNDLWYEVEVVLGEHHMKVKALLDTGNGLVEQSSGKPVHILDFSREKDVISQMHENTTFEIPYHTIGGAGVMRAFCADRMHVRGEKECWIEHPIIAISEETVSKSNTYNMILNPGIF